MPSDTQRAPACLPRHRRHGIEVAADPAADLAIRGAEVR